MEKDDLKMLNTNWREKLTIQVRKNEHLVRNTKMKPKIRKEERPRRTTGRTSAMVATDSQMTPLRKEDEYMNPTSTVGEKHHHTCFHRSRVRSHPPQPSWRRRNRPASMMRRRAMSVTSTAMRVGAFSAPLTGKQPRSAGIHETRSYIGK